MRSGSRSVSTRARWWCLLLLQQRSETTLAAYRAATSEPGDVVRGAPAELEAQCRLFALQRDPGQGASAQPAFKTDRQRASQ